MIAVVKEKHDFATNFLLKLSGGDNLGIEKSFWEKAHGCCPKQIIGAAMVVKLEMTSRKWFAAALD